MEIIIELKEDESVEMALVSVNGKIIMEGNYWDFHNGCHGINDYGDFYDRHSLVDSIKLQEVTKGNNVKIIKTKYQWGG